MKTARIEPELSVISAGTSGSVSEVLERYAREAPRLAYRANDPVRCCHRYPEAEDREVVALFCALLAFGRVGAFLPGVEALLGIMGRHPRRYVEEFRPGRNRGFFASFRLRLWGGEDLRYLLVSLARLFREFSTLEEAFLADGGEGSPGTAGGLSAEHSGSGGSAHRARLTRLARLLHRGGGGGLKPPPYYRNLVVDPAAGSACKRWNLFLRWVARPADGVDLGLWKRVSPRDLIIPLDVHVGRISLQIGLRRRRTLDWRAAEEVTGALARIDPADPLRFDLPLSHLGISAGCRGRYLEPICDACGIRSLCSVYRKRRASR
jgi:uncharacterized protein (TIGR02757 family)